ncbi:30373_t:CDS:2 [Gigaspora margarita]|uniref:30373_t:CDS:1 n=1 Tax=Gigaspora margarita TaxID=4874 RepID=A0ABN7UVW7_GIGMA|nr:30373_t:CDS:2 [Gigaspora margarita]
MLTVLDKTSLYIVHILWQRPWQIHMTDLIKQLYQQPAQKYQHQTKSDKHGRTTPRQKCNHCEEDYVDLIGRLKEHLTKCKSFQKNVLNLQVSAGIPFTAIETHFGEEFMEAVNTISDIKNVLNVRP